MFSGKLPGVGAFVTLVMFGAAGSAAGDDVRGFHGAGHDLLHSWYKTLRQPGTGFSCCNNEDCRPTQARTRGGAIEVIVDGEWTPVPPSTILKQGAPDLNAHVCAPKVGRPRPIFCVVLGFGV